MSAGEVMPDPLVSVVIVSWNRKNDVLETLPSILEQNYSNYEIVVVDNGSSDGLGEAVGALYPAVKLVTLNSNTGAAGGRNAGIEHASGEIIFFLDSDASLQSDTLTQTVRQFQLDPKLGAVACKVVNSHTGQVDEIGRFFSHRADPNQAFLSFSFCAAGCAISAETLQKAGHFWDFMFFIREEEELGLRIWEAGYKILYYPQAIVHHRESPQTRVRGYQREYLDLRNCFYIYLVHYPWWMLSRFLLVKTSIALLRSMRRRNLRRTALPAFSEVVRQLPYLWQQRRPMSDQAAQCYFNLQRHHGPLSWNLIDWLKYKA